MRIEQSAALPAPFCRLRLTFGALNPRGPKRTPLVLALPWGQPERDGRVIVHLDHGERIDAEAVSTLTEAVRAGGSVVFACASLADAATAFGTLAEFAGYPVTNEGARGAA